MKKNLSSNLLILLLLISGCSANQEKTAATYFYDPAISTIEGTIGKETFWGAPSFGEDTTGDIKEICFVLYPLKPIHISGDEEDGYNEEQHNVSRIQILTTKELESFVKETKVTVKGKLFGAHTGHHHTNVLLELTEIKTIPGN